EWRTSVPFPFSEVKCAIKTVDRHRAQAYEDRRCEEIQQTLHLSYQDRDADFAQKLRQWWAEAPHYVEVGKPGECRVRHLIQHWPYNDDAQDSKAGDRKDKVACFKQMFDRFGQAAEWDDAVYVAQ